MGTCPLVVTTTEGLSDSVDFTVDVAVVVPPYSGVEIQGKYFVKLYNTNGELVAEFDHWRTLEVHRKLNDIDTHTLYLPKDDPRIELFTLDSIVKIMRRLPGSNWYEEYKGFHRTPQRTISEADRQTFVSYGVGMNDLIHRRAIQYHATTAYTLKSGPGETVIKAYVNENVGPAATMPPRLLDGVTTGFSIEVDSGRGLNWFGQRSYRNVLEIIQEIALATGVDFEVVYIDPVLFEFRCYYPQMGTDRRLTCKFSPELGNMVIPSYTLSRTQEGNTAVVMGQGEGKARRTLIIKKTAAADSPWNQCEISVDARQEETYNGILSAGNAELERTKAEESFTFQVMQTAGMQYGRDYFMGDIITAKFDTIERVKKIVGVKLNIAEGKEDISLEFGDYPPTA